MGEWVAMMAGKNRDGSSAGGSRTKGLPRPDPSQAEPGLHLWAGLICRIYDELYDRNNPTARLGLNELAQKTTYSPPRLSAVFNGKTPFDWVLCERIVKALDGRPAQWKHRWQEVDDLYRQGKTLGTWAPLPGMDDDGDPAQTQDDVRDWDHPSWRVWRRPLRVARDLLVTPWRALSRRRRLAERARRRHVFLQLVRARAVALLGAYEEGRPLPAHFAKRATRPGEEPRPYPDGTTVTQVFEDCAENLLLISSPGLGKTTQLALLAEELVQRALAAEPDQEAVVPILVSLSSYHGQPFEEWLVGEISTAYDIAPAVVRVLLAGTHPRAAGRRQDTDDVLLLFDGLDDVRDQEHRRECARQLIGFRRRCVGMVLTCRSRDRRLAETISGLYTVIIDQPTEQDVRWYLTTADSALLDVREALETDNSLWGLLRSPLMLYIIGRTYAGRRAVELRQHGTIQERQGRIFDAYIDRMLYEHRTGRYSAEQIITWLTWLARTLTARGEQAFYLDRLDESWAPSRSTIMLRVVHKWVFQYSVFGLALIWLTIAHTLGVFTVSDPLATAKAVGLSAGMLIFFTIFAYRKVKPTNARTNAVALAVLLATSAPSDFLGGDGRVFQLLMVAIMFAQVFVTDGLLLTNRSPVEELKWTWRPRLRGLTGAGEPTYALIGIAIGLASVALFGWFIVTAFELLTPDSSSNPILITVALAIGLLYLFVADHFEPSLQDVRDRPNEGIRRSFKYACIIGSCSGIAMGMIYVALVRLALPDIPWRSAWLLGVLLAVVCGWSHGYRFGGVACVYHWAVRMSLVRSKIIPLDYLRFLHEAEQRILIRRIGNGFVFPHRLLLEHMAISPEALLERLQRHSAVPGDDAPMRGQE
ncbi:hypothetical protein [Nonomuraea soli]|uniref:NACHT domain-containing protein n=1 Tax=Nonomuraea soli TaxID=1032476 RepID=A0A7W0CV98_9ACTN|nr:hypothetical protein [Nonomuraea soli]MBA2897783.1 hypothetical protein [Nonomuraea soli]